MQKDEESIRNTRVSPFILEEAIPDKAIGEAGINFKGWTEENYQRALISAKVLLESLQKRLLSAHIRNDQLSEKVRTFESELEANSLLTSELEAAQERIKELTSGASGDRLLREEIEAKARERHQEILKEISLELD